MASDLQELIQPGSLARIDKQSTLQPIYLQVSNIRQTNAADGLSQFLCDLSDGIDSWEGVLASQLSSMIRVQMVTDGSVLRIINYSVTSVSDKKMSVTEADTQNQNQNQNQNSNEMPSKKQKLSESGQYDQALSKQQFSMDNTPEVSLGSQMKVKSDIKMSGNEEVNQNEAIKPENQNKVQNGSVTTPSKQSRNYDFDGQQSPPTEAINRAITPQGIRKSGHKKCVTPLKALNPYSREFTIQVIVLKKNDMRTIKKRDVFNLFSVVLQDLEGSKIEATFWKDMANKYYNLIQAGKAYYFEKFSVGINNKTFSALDVDYKIDMLSSSVIEESDSQAFDVQKDVNLVDVVPLPNLPNYIGRKSPITVCGVVIESSTLQQVKRKSDNQEINRVDLTICDQSFKSVKVTLWHQNAVSADQKLKGLTNPVIMLGSILANDYAGISLSQMSSGSVEINNLEIIQVSDLKSWWDYEGNAERSKIEALGQKLASTQQMDPSKMSQRHHINQLQSVVQLLQTQEQVNVSNLSQQQQQQIRNSSYVNVQCKLCSINEDKPLSYLAHPQSNKKVVEQDGRYFCEGDQSWSDTAQHRYVVSAKIIDSTDSAIINMFNDQVEQILGISADRLEQVKIEDEQQYKEILRKPIWLDLILRIQLRKRNPKEQDSKYQYNVASLLQVNYAKESQRLLLEIEQMKQKSAQPQQLEKQQSPQLNEVKQDFSSFI